MALRELTTIILAAGEGTRMKSARAKVLHEIAGAPLLAHVMKAASAAASSALAVIIGPGCDDVADMARRFAGKLNMKLDVFVQNERRGTAHAALEAGEVLTAATGDVLIAFGDTPLLTPATFAALRQPLAGGADIAVAAFAATDPSGYGRVLCRGDQVIAIREERDATVEERQITLCNGGLMAISAKHALRLLKQVGNANAKGEYYLTDIVEVARAEGLIARAVMVDEDELRGVNTRAQLADTEALMQQRLRRQAMEAGVTLVAPDTVFFAHDTVLGNDVWIGPHVVFGPGVSMAGPGEILGFSHLAGCRIAAGARIGPFARIRPQTTLGENVHIGNFVEINRSLLDADVQANHLAYVGDAEVGRGSNIGAGTITCNFDGAEKHHTRIGRDVFVGSNSTLVAPISIGDDVLIAAGSTLTKNVADGALAFGRARQSELDGKGRDRVIANRAKRAARKARGA